LKEREIGDVFPIFESFETLDVFFFCFASILLKVSKLQVFCFLALFYSQSWHPLLIAQNIEKLNNNSFHPWKMKMEFLLREKDMCKITLGELLALEVEFGEIVLKRGVIEHGLFIERTNWLVEQF
jgi:hypothetical protein